MRQIILVMLLGGLAFGQTMVDSAAAAAGGSMGAIGGKKVSDGISGIFDRADRPAGKPVTAAKQPEKKSVTSVSPLQAPTRENDSVPPPPALARHATLHKPIAPAPAPRAENVQPQPREVTAVDLHSVTMGMDRAQVLELGEPASRMMTSDDGHLMEVYRYPLGAVHLIDGAVSSIDFHE